MHVDHGCFAPCNVAALRLDVAFIDRNLAVCVPAAGPGAALPGAF